MASTSDKKKLKEDILRNVEMIPKLSPAATKLISLVSKTSHSVEEVVEVVRCDAALTARLLRIVNSPLFGLMVTIDSVDRAVVYLGTKMVAGIAIGDSAPEIFNAALAGYGSVSGALWKHTLFVAIAARELAGYSKVPIDKGLAFTGGILHDIGKVIIADYLGEDPYEATGDIEKGKYKNYLDAERGIVGLDHAQVGYLIAKRWGLPESLRTVILEHHTPSKAEMSSRALVYAVHLGDVLSMQWGHGTGADTLRYQVDEGFEEFFELEQSDLSNILLVAEEEYGKIATSLTRE